MIKHYLLISPNLILLFMKSAAMVLRLEAPDDSCMRLFTFALGLATGHLSITVMQGKLLFFITIERILGGRGCKFSLPLRTYCHLVDFY